MQLRAGRLNEKVERSNVLKNPKYYKATPYSPRVDKGEKPIKYAEPYVDAKMAFKADMIFERKRLIHFQNEIIDPKYNYSRK